MTTSQVEALRSQLAVDLGQTHDHEIGIHDLFERVFAAQADALLARGWTLLATPTEAPDGLDAPHDEIVARLAIVSHIAGETDGCTGAEDVPWCDACWRSSESFIRADSTDYVAKEARDALARRLSSETAS